MMLLTEVISYSNINYQSRIKPAVIKVKNVFHQVLIYSGVYKKKISEVWDMWDSEGEYHMWSTQ